MRAVACALLLVACHAGADALHKKYPSPYHLERFSGWKAPGLELWTVQAPSVPDRNGDHFIVGVDKQGKLVSGFALFKVAAPGLEPDELARRAFDTLLARAGGGGLDPAKDTPLSMFPKEEWALVKAPSVEGRVLTFWYVEGEMHPEVTRGQLDLDSGEFKRRRAGDVLHPPEAAIPGIREKLHASDVAIVKAGLASVGEWKELLPDVESLLDHADGGVRSQALGVLENFHQPRSVPAVSKLLENGPDWADRSNAGQALLFRFGTPEAVAAVRAHVKRGGSGQEIYVLRGALEEYDKGRRQ